MAKIYIEGGDDSKELHARCREGFRRLLEKAGFSGRMPRLVACGGRNRAFDDFQSAIRSADKSAFVALLVDSEDPVADGEQSWSHLSQRDGWQRPNGVTDDQALLMVTCMETWIVADRPTLREHYGAQLNENALPPLPGCEARPRGEIQEKLKTASQSCRNAYAKGKKSFELMGKIQPAELMKHLPSFKRFVRVLDQNL